MNKIIKLVGMLLLLVLASCAPTPPSAADDGYAPQIIIKFADTAANPSDTHFVQELSHELGVGLEYVRPMSGVAHVFKVHGLHDAAELQEVLRHLAKRPGVVYAEEDRMRRKQ